MPAADPLSEYNARRDFKATPEPAGKRGRQAVCYRHRGLGSDDVVKRREIVTQGVRLEVSELDRAHAVVEDDGRHQRERER